MVLFEEFIVLLILSFLTISYCHKCANFCSYDSNFIYFSCYFHHYPYNFVFYCCVQIQLGLIMICHLRKHFLSFTYLSKYHVQCDLWSHSCLSEINMVLQIYFYFCLFGIYFYDLLQRSWTFLNFYFSFIPFLYILSLIQNLQNIYDHIISLTSTAPQFPLFLTCPHHVFFKLNYIKTVFSFYYILFVYCSCQLPTRILSFSVLFCLSEYICMFSCIFVYACTYWLYLLKNLTSLFFVDFHLV